MKRIGVLLVAVALSVIIIAALSAVVIIAALTKSRFLGDSVAAYEWTDVCHGAVMFISLATDAQWVTNYTYKITFLFSVKNISGCSNATTFYNNSYVILNNVKLDPAYMINISEYPFRQLSERQTWNVDWYFTPKADNFVLACMGISRGKCIQYPLPLEVDYTVVDSEGVEWQGLFQTNSHAPCATITIVGGEDAP